jgi:hypothetical protein
MQLILTSLNMANSLQVVSTPAGLPTTPLKVTQAPAPAPLSVAKLAPQPSISIAQPKAPAPVSVQPVAPQTLNPTVINADGSKAVYTPPTADTSTLSAEHKTQLRDIVGQMLTNKEPDAHIKAVVSAYTEKYGGKDQPTYANGRPTTEGPVKAAFKGLGSDLGAKVAQGIGGIIKPFAQVAASGVRALQATPDVFTGNVAGAQQTMAKPIGGLKTLAGQTPVQNVGTALEIGSNLVGLGETGTVSSIAKGTIGKAAVQGAKQGALGNIGGYLTTDQPHTAGGVIKAGLSGAGTGLVVGAVGAAAEPLFTGQKTPIQAAKDLGKTVAQPIKSMKSVISPDAETALIKAIKPAKNNTSFRSDLQNVIPVVQDTAALSNKPVTDLRSLLDNVVTSKKRIWQDYQNILGPNAKATVDGNIIADAMVEKLDRRFITQNPEKANAIRATSDTYRRKLTLEEAEEFLQSANNDLNAYYNKNKVSQSVAARDPEKGYVVAEADTLRKLLYDKLEGLTGKNAAQIKKTYGALTNVQNEVNGRINVNDRQAPISLGQQVSRISALGDIVKGVDFAKPGQTVMNVGSGLGKVALGDRMRLLNDSDYLVGSAFKQLSARPK